MPLFLSRTNRRALVCPLVFCLVVVAVAQVAAHGVHDVANLDVGLQSLGGEHVVEGQVLLGLGLGGESVDLVETVGGVAVLPDAPVVVNEGVVHEEDRVTGRRGDVGHDSADTVVAVGVRTGNIC